MLTEHENFSCPWCGAPNTLEVEPEEAGQWLVQDCQVCCQPIELRWQDDPAGRRLEVGRESG
jgi:hypothetical protein